MARSLRKHKLDGTPYLRRDKVEFEIQALAEISAAELERRAIAASLAATGGNKLATARQLGISRATLYQRLENPDGNLDK